MSNNGTTICLLDDDASVLKATSRMLSYAGYRVQSFTDPTTFLTYAFDHQPSVAVLDILMPAMNGLEVQRRLRHISPSTRVIILSSKDDPLVRATAMREGALVTKRAALPERYRRLLRFTLQAPILSSATPPILAELVS
jgi:FixJ family two-component response regulator